MDNKEHRQTQNTENARGDCEKKLEACEKQRDEYLAGWQRAKADFINYRKEEMMRMEEIARYGNEDLIVDLIGVMDNFDLGIRALEKAGPVEKGIYMIRANIEDILKRRGLERIKVKPGTIFDPATMEAIGEGESDAQPGTIIEEIEPGYRLHNKVIRPARIKVAKQTI